MQNLTKETIQSNYDKRRAKSRLPLYSIKVQEVRNDGTVVILMQGCTKPIATNEAWDGLTSLTTGNVNSRGFGY